MAKAALLDVLQQTIGRYVKNLDPESLNVAVWKGKIELNSLELDVESINSLLDKRAEEAPNLAMPFKVLSGRFESLEVDVPWSQITSRPVILRARGLSMIVEALDRSSSHIDVDDDERKDETTKQILRVAKQKEIRNQKINEKNSYRLQSYALKKIALAVDKDRTSEDNEGDKTTFTTRLVTRIIENIQVEIINVHVSLRNDDGSAGVVLESLKFMTTDTDGNKVYIDRTAAPRNSSCVNEDMSFQYKTFQIQGFGVYLDEDEFESARKSLGTVSEDFQSIASDNGSFSSLRSSITHSYILAPLSFETKLRIADKKSSANDIKYQTRSNLSSIAFLLTRNQMDIARKVVKIMSPSNLGPTPLFPQYRPLVLVKGNAKEWWKYAVRCIGRMSGRRSWLEFLKAYSAKKRYIPLFKRQAHHKECPWVKPLDCNEIDELITLEHDRSISIDGLMLWRNIADAQIDKERDKRNSERTETTSTSMFSYVFGRSTSATTIDKSELEKLEEEPAVLLSVEEMKELEGLSELDITEKVNDQDSILYDVEFVLDSMKIDLVGYDYNHVASLDMGKVNIDFTAALDGAFKSSFELYDLEIIDRITPKSLFPSVLSMIERDPDPETVKSRALLLDISMSSSGDQNLIITMAEFQLVASKFMFRELQQFFQDSHEKTDGFSLPRIESNPVLRKSFSGSVDLFYDAKQGESIIQPPFSPKIQDEVRVNNSPVVSKEILSNKFFDVWKKKSKRKASWMLDLDVKAPVVLIPETCNDAHANVLVFDLGNLKINYGKGDPSAMVQKWFDENPRQSLVDRTFEVGLIDVNHLTFSVQKANALQSTEMHGKKESTIIDPIGVFIDFAIEDIGPTFDPRSCFLGVIPTISLKLSTAQMPRILRVINSWTDIFSSNGEIVRNESKPCQSPLEHDIHNGLIEQSNVANLQIMKEQSVSSKEQDSISIVDEDSPIPMFYSSIGLQRLSVVIIDEEQKQLEAHLVSVYASILKWSDATSIARLKMGYFWILDWTTTNFVRRQRLVIHSNLPRSAVSFAEDNKYDVIEELTNQGVFERHYSGSTELADVSFKTLTRNARPSSAGDIIIDRNLKTRRPSNIQHILDVKFRSLVVHWNPHAIKAINGLVDRFITSATTYDNSMRGDRGTLILTSEVSQSSRRLKEPKRIPSKDNVDSTNQWLIMAKMESLDINLNSARDDLPLFMLTVSCTQLSVVPLSSGQEISLSLGDLRVATPENAGKTLPYYRTLLGLETGSTESLLTVKYCEGREAIESLNLFSVDTQNLDAVTDVELSPMRFCYVQSQVMTLINYITDGILGALAAKAAMSAAEAAKDFAKSVSGDYYYCVRATSFEAVVPEAAYREEQMSLTTASLNVDYFMYSNTRMSHIRVELSDLMVKGNHKKELQESPIRLSVDVKMPQAGFGSADDQAMKINAAISNAKFSLTKDQYAQILMTLSKNFQETALFLRDDECSGQVVTSAKETHSGTQVDESNQRIYFILDMKEVSLVFNGKDQADPIVRLTAMETTVSMDMIPDLEKFSIQVSLQNLVCEDCRLIALKRQCRHLIDQNKTIDTIKNTNIFQIGYTQEKNDSEINLRLGSPQVILIPDLISEVILFVSGTESNQNDKTPPLSMSSRNENITSSTQQIIQIDSAQIRSISDTSLKSSNYSVTKISAQTGTCRFVLMDLGSQSPIDKGLIYNPESSDSEIQLTEIIVLQGIFSGSYSNEFDINSGNSVATDFQFHSDAMEIFTAFGIEMKSPLQILEPASASAHGSSKTTNTGDNAIEVRAAALTPIEFLFSIHNAALLMAIIDSIQSSIKHADTKETPDTVEPLSLTPKEQERIEKLATALERLERDESFTRNESGSSFCDSRASSSHLLSETDTSPTTQVQIKLTMPQARVTCINDLQGMDEALFRITVTNFVAGGNLLSPRMIFDFHCNTSILADYFDSSVNLWSRLLIKPWEITIKGSRALSRRLNSRRLSSNFDLESFPCWISFSEQFLVSLASTSRMWSIYSAASNSSLDANYLESASNDQNLATTTTANFNLITSFPYAVSNHCGTVISFSLKSGNIEERSCSTNYIHYFRFDPPNGDGYGGKRVYGQDVEAPKLVEIKFKGSTIVVDFDVEFGLSPSAHEIGDGLVLFISVVREGKTTVLHLTSQIEVFNNTLIPFNIDFCYNEESLNVGKIKPKNFQVDKSATLSSEDDILCKKSSNFSIPISFLSRFRQDWEKYGRAHVCLSLTPVVNEVNGFTNKSVELLGKVETLVSLQELSRARENAIKSRVEVTCRTTEHLTRATHSLTLSVVLTIKLVSGEHVTIDVSLQPRAFIENRMPLAMKVRTPMPQTFSTCQKEENNDTEVTYLLDPNGCVEVFTPGPSIAITTRTRDNPIAGLELGWLDGGWVDLPLVQELRLQDPIMTAFPLKMENIDVIEGKNYGAEFFIVEGKDSLHTITDFGTQKTNNTTVNPSFKKNRLEPRRNVFVDDCLSFFLTIRNYGVDHTGNILFEQVSSVVSKSSLRQSNKSIRESDVQRRRGSNLLTELDPFAEGFNLLRLNSEKFNKQSSPNPFGAFSSPFQGKRVSLLPNPQFPICLLLMTMEVVEGFKRTTPFMIESLPIGDGGAATVPIVWENKEHTGLFAYRCLINEHQSEVHIIPEFIVFNGSETTILVKEETMPEVIIEPGDTGQLRSRARPDGLELSFQFIELNYHTAPMPVSKLGLKVRKVESNYGVLVGSVYIQTVIDTRGDARLVVKVGKIKYGSLSTPTSMEKGLFCEDFFRFRVRWTELQFILNEVEQKRESWNIKALRGPQNSSTISDTEKKNMKGVDQKIPKRASTLNIFKQELQNRHEGNKIQMIKQPIMAMIFSRFTVDFQSVFKDEEKCVDRSRRSVLDASSSQRSQISIIVHNVQIKDLTPSSRYPIVFDSTSDLSVFDLCIRIRGSLNADLVKVDLFDLNLAHQNGISEKMTLTTSEDYLWRILDVVNRILSAGGEVSDITLKYESDDVDGYVIKIEDSGKPQLKSYEKNQYTPPTADTLYDIALARVSPFTVVVSFRRIPEQTRVSKVKGGAPSAPITNYFTQKLKFTIDKAELNFTRYEHRHLKGPSDCLIETLSTVYVSRMKFKVVSLLSAASLQDWRYLAARDDGDDEYVEGDILRATGNLAGKSAGLLFKTVGRGVGGGLIRATSYMGEGIENGTSKIGARRFGTGVSSVVTGMGHGVGDTVSGVGTGAAKFLQGAGQGVGHVFGGVSGGALQIGKGIGKGITTGDGRAVVDGIAKGASSVGGGIAQGAESAVVGTADGLLTAGKGIFSGFKNVGQGIGGAFTGKKPSRFERKVRENDK